MWLEVLRASRKKGEHYRVFLAGRDRSSTRRTLFCCWPMLYQIRKVLYLVHSPADRCTRAAHEWVDAVDADGTREETVRDAQICVFWKI